VRDVFSYIPTGLGFDVRDVFSYIPSSALGVHIRDIFSYIPVCDWLFPYITSSLG